MEMSDLPDRVQSNGIKMLTERRTMHEQGRNFNKEMENIKTYQKSPTAKQYKK